ncbi:MAG TPA: hypothetical protein VE685_25010, partial [Thermoanaerobaculia bacterium]|nr:hypothetical protein [Thermoanaerobaculia bacterium]
VVVDLVRDLAPQLFPDKPLIGGIRIDPPEEILANKLCALLTRAGIWWMSGLSNRTATPSRMPWRRRLEKMPA